MNRLLPALAVVALVLCAGFAAERYLKMAEAQEALDASILGLTEAQALSARHPEVFGAAGDSQQVSLKPLVQETGARHGIALAFLTETEKESGDGIRERSVLCRAVNVEQGKLIKFLFDLEKNGQGARLRELRLKPAPERSDMFQEAEGVLTIRSLSKTGKQAGDSDKSEGGKGAR
jgi:hypothetical protein